MVPLDREFQWVNVKHRGSRLEVFCKKGVLKSFAKQKPATLLVKRLWHSKFCEIFKNTFFYRTPPVGASENKNHSDKFRHIQP